MVTPRVLILKGSDLMHHPSVPRRTRRHHGASAAVRLAVAAIFAAVLGGYALALGATGVPVLVAMVIGALLAIALVGAITRD